MNGGTARPLLKGPDGSDPVVLLGLNHREDMLPNLPQETPS